MNWPKWWVKLIYEFNMPVPFHFHLFLLNYHPRKDQNKRKTTKLFFWDCKLFFWDWWFGLWHFWHNCVLIKWINHSPFKRQFCSTNAIKRYWMKEGLLILHIPSSEEMEKKQSLVRAFGLERPIQRRLALTHLPPPPPPPRGWTTFANFIRRSGDPFLRRGLV